MAALATTKKRQLRRSIITEAGVDPHVVGLVYVAAHAPDVGEDEGALGKKTPSVLAKTEGAIKKTDDGFTYLNPADFPKLFAPDLPHDQAEFESRSQVFAAAEVFDTPLMGTGFTAASALGNGCVEDHSRSFAVAPLTRSRITSDNSPTTAPITVTPAVAPPSRTRK